MHPLDTKLLEAAKDGNIEKIKALIKAGADPHCWTDSLGDDAPLRTAAYREETEAIALLLNLGGTNPDYEKDLELLDAIKELGRSGEILDCLLPSFNQTGEYEWLDFWSGREVFMGGFVEAKLPKNRIITVDPQGKKHLNTSFVEKFHMKNKERKHKLELDFSSIAGSIQTGYCQEVHLPNLEYLGGNFYGSAVKNLYAPKLRHIGGALHLQAQNVDLPSLEFIGKEPYGEGLELKRAKKIELTSLKEIRGQINAPEATSVKAPRLQKIGGSLIAPKLQTLEVQSLKELQGLPKIPPPLVPPILNKLTLKNLQKWLRREGGNKAKAKTIAQKVQAEILKRQYLKSLPTLTLD